MKLVLLMWVFLNAPMSFSAEPVSLLHDSLVRAEITRVYVRGWEDDQFQFSPQRDVWGLRYVENPSACVAMVRGLAYKPTYGASAIYEFWVCIREVAPNQLLAEIWDEQSIE